MSDTAEPIWPDDGVVPYCSTTCPLYLPPALTMLETPVPPRCGANGRFLDRDSANVCHAVAEERLTRLNDAREHLHRIRKKWDPILIDNAQPNLARDLRNLAAVMEGTYLGIDRFRKDPQQ